jgi:chromosome segregation ATPase
MNRIMKKWTTIRQLNKRIEELELQVNSHTVRIFSTEQRLDALDRLLKGGAREREGLFFRVTQLEQLINLKTHIKPVTKKQMGEIRKLLRKGWLK